MTVESLLFFLLGHDLDEWLPAQYRHIASPDPLNLHLSDPILCPNSWQQ